MRLRLKFVCLFAIIAFSAAAASAQPTATQSQVNLTCNSICTGSATVVASGGVAPYTYSWSPSGGSGATASSLCATNYTVTITDASSASITKTFTLTQPPPIVVAPISQTNVACFGGSNGAASATASGGTGTLTYNWTPGNPTGDGTPSVTGLTAGVWTVTVTDANSCTTTRTFNLTQAPALTATISSSTNVSCNGGSNGGATVVAAGGVPGYTYSWSPSGGTAATTTGRLAGIYTVTVTDANSCTTSQTTVITQPPAIVFSASQTNVACNGATNGAASVSVSGGIAPYTYSWAPTGGTGATATGLSAGSYTVTISDSNSCTRTATFNITQPPAIATTGSQTNVSCNGGSNGNATVAASGGAGPYTYSWAPSGGTAATATGLSAGTYTVTVTDSNNCQSTHSFTITQPPAISFVRSQTNVSCNGGSNGSATVAASGGTSPYTYSWAPSGGTAATASGLAAGNYTVTVTDSNSCTNAATFAITQPTVLTATTSSLNVSCNGGANGSATVVASGGTPGYTYSWSPAGGTAATASGLAAGTYTVIVTDANGCTTTKTAAVTQPPVLSATPASQTNVSCNGGTNGSASVVASGGVGPYTYSWSPTGGTGATASGLSAGTYTVTVTDAAGCSKPQMFTITQPPALTATPASQTNVSCNGGSNGSATVAASGGTPGYTYSWAPSGGTAATATNLGAGIYTVTVTDANACSTSTTFTITEPPLLTAAAGSQTNVSCNGGSDGSATVAPSGGTAPYTYAWAPTGGFAATASGLSAGTYTVTVLDANSCSTTRVYTITQPPALITTGSQVDATCAASNGSATVVAAGGTPGYSYSWAPSGGTAATASGLSAGTYTVTVLDAGGCSTTRSFTITSPPALTSSGSQTDATCGASNGSATVVPAGGTPGYTYAWAPSGGTASTATGLAAGAYTVTVTDAAGCVTTRTFAINSAAGPSTTGVQTDVSCNGGTNGSATVIPSGGTAPYTYSWAPSGGTAATAATLPAGSYTVTVTDANGCAAIQTFTITQPPPLTATSSQTNVSCNGGSNGSATVSAAGGTAPYSYLWAPSGGTSATAAALTAGTYTVTVTDANGCFTTRSYTITQPAPLLANGTSTPLTATGTCTGTAAVAPTGGTAPYAIVWSPGGATTSAVSALCGPTATATITDANGCSTVFTATISGPTADVSISIGSTSAPVSAGGSVAYTITAITTADAPNPTVTGNVPAGTTFQSLTAPAAWSCSTPAAGATGSFTCTSATLLQAAPAVFSLQVNVPQLYGAGAIPATVSIDAAVIDPAPANNTASTSTAIVTPARLVAVKTVSTSAGQVAYVITIQNSGPAAQLDDPASDEFTDVLPAELNLVTATSTAGTVATAGNTVRWNGALVAGGTVTINITASVASTAATGSVISNQGQVRYDADGNGVNDSVEGTRPAPTAAPAPTTFTVSAGIPLFDPAVVLALFALLACVALFRLRG